MRYQNPPLERMESGAYYFRATVPTIEGGRIIRRRKRFALGTSNKAEAQKLLAEALKTINQGRVIAQAQIRFGAVLDRFLSTHVPTLAAATQDKYQALIRSHIRPAFGHLPISEVTRPVIQGWLVSLDRSSATRDTLRNCLSSIFSRAEEWGLWEGRNPVEGVRLPRRAPVYEREHLEQDRFLALLREVRGTRFVSDEGARLVVLIGYGAGLNISEILGLQWRDLEGEYLRVRRVRYRGSEGATKTANRERRNYIGPIAPALERYRRGAADEAWIFDGFDDRDFQAHVLRPAAKRAGVYRKGFGMHHLRRLYVTERQHAGATPFEAAKGAGHAKPSTTWIYTLTSAAREKEQVNEMLKGVVQ